MVTSILGFLASRKASSEQPAWSDDVPIRHEVFAEDRLREHAESLARSHRIVKHGISHRAVLGRVRSNYRLLKEVYADLMGVAAAGGSITPAAEWLIDNFHTAEQHIQQIIEDLPSGYYSQLPKLADGHLQSYPRVMAIAWAYIAHTDSHFDKSTLAEFVNAYQDVSQLTIGELWALAIHLRILLIENASRVASRTAVSRQARDMADAAAERFKTLSIADLTALMTDLPEHAKLSFAVQLIKRVRAQRHVGAEALAALQDIIRLTGHDPENAAHDEHARQVSNNLTMQNIFTSLKRIAEQNWEEWFESVSSVDRTLAESGIYRNLDSASRTSYRNAIEDLARHSNRTELQVASLAVAGGLQGDPGDFLIGGKRQSLQQQIGYRMPLVRSIRNFVRGQGAAGYLAAIGTVAAIIVLIGHWALAEGTVTMSAAIILLLLLFGPAFESAMAMVNYAVTQLMRPMVLPSLWFDHGIPPEHRTMIAVPTMITSHHGIEEMLERIERHFLSNDDPQLSYALLSDWKDSGQEKSPEDDALLDAARTGIAKLNARHGHNRFMILHRARRWNGSQGVWMGWERKRGKLHELNRLLRGATDTSFIHLPEAIPQHVKYVIVLDADTLLPRGAGRRLVGKMAHPLNRPHIDTKLGRVASGYGIMQPRVTIALPERGRGTRFQQIFSGRPGLDPYVFATSDVYQDLFGEGSFTGKGIYDIDAFEAAVAGRIAENTVLSHDLFEGNFARAGLVSDIQVVEDFPERYVVDVARHHRWARGDWQLLPWMLPPARGLSGLGFWKMSDNLRRTLTPALTLAGLITGWAILPPGSAFAWTLFIIALLFVPALLPIFAGSSLRREPTTLESQILTIGDDIVSALTLTGARLVFLAHQSWVMLDAVVRTLHRVYVSRRNLLEWATAAQLQSSLKPSLAGTYRLMFPSVAIGVAVFLAFFGLPSGLSAASLPLALAWCLAPAFAYWISMPALDRSSAELEQDVRRDLRKIALRTWRYFDAHVVSGDNMLPPDNFQEDPLPQIAHRTSPTNIGLYLLSTVSACEMGWIGRDEAFARLSATLSTTARLETYRGHLFNWYDTQTLQPLEPRYVSTVDSGNLAGHLVSVANACEAWRQMPATDATRLDGIVDAALILSDVVVIAGRLNRPAAALASQAGELLQALVRTIEDLKMKPDAIPLRAMSIGVQVNVIEQLLQRLHVAVPVAESEAGLYWVGRLRNAVEALIRETTRDRLQQMSLDSQLASVAKQCRDMAYGMNFEFLLDRQRQLLSIGYRMEDETLDQSCYDLLASEAALTSFLAIAKGDVEEKHWIRLGRPVTAVNKTACLVSWSGSMFEYLMPLLVMRDIEGTLGSQTHRLVVQRQMDYAKARATPWGISESAFAVRDRGFTYQYSNFGVPGLGLKRGLGDNHVIAPYATGLAAMVAPREAVENYRRLESIGGSGRFGFYEAIDFTPARLRAGHSHEVIRAYFAHHQGMTITAIHNAVSGGALREHFHRENTVRATELLLQERAPNHLPSKIIGTGRPEATKIPKLDAVEHSRHVQPEHELEPVTHLLSNGRYSVMLTDRGTGYSRWNGIAINRWRRDAIEDESGQSIFLRDLATSATWPAVPARSESGPFHGHAIFSQEKAEYFRTDAGITTHLECMVSTEDDAEARCLHLVNTSDEARSVEYTTFLELALADPLADDAHPAFSKLFVETEFVPDLQALVATRRKRQDSDPVIWVAQFIVSDNETATPVQYETAREKFLGRGRPLSEARALSADGQLLLTTGSVLDAVFALRQTVTLLPHRKSRTVIWTMVAESRDALLEKVSRHRAMAVFERVQVLAWTQSRILLRHLSIDTAEANLFQQLAASIVYSSPRYRPDAAAIAGGMKSQATLWPQSISGNRPIVMVKISDVDDIGLVEQVLRAQDYWQEKGLSADIVIVNERRTSYMQDLQNLLDALVAKERVSRSLQSGGDGGEIFLLRSDLISPGTQDALAAAAHVVLDAAYGTLDQQLKQTVPAMRTPMPLSIRKESSVTNVQDMPNGEGLQFFNGFGGFDVEAREYVILHRESETLPAPWINVIANPEFGTHCSAEGGGYSWYGNSRERQITAWSNDAVRDRPSEMFYIHDRDTGLLSSPTVQPLGPRSGIFKTRHGFGYTIHEASEHELDLVLTQTVDTRDPVKRTCLRISNTGKISRTLAVTFYGEAVMGQRRAATSHVVTSDYDAASNALFLRNRWSMDFADTVVFADLQGRQASWTANRSAVFGARGDSRLPRGLANAQPLSKETGGGYDPCIALQAEIMLQPQESVEIVLTLGAAKSEDHARQLVDRYRTRNFGETLAAQQELWRGLVDRVQVKTPDPAFDLMMNGWLLYQTISCRMWARSGFYQASGAYGFRDQLQDSMTMAHVLPDLARQHILLAASRQFEEGDVQHWWLPESGAGVRTQISDDTAWLAYCTAYYVKLTGDTSILDERVSFLKGRQLEQGEHDAFYIPEVSSHRATLYDHCVLGLSRNAKSGVHGLPLMGTGDWNDGMNRVGEHGKGESIWLGWFLCSTLTVFEEIATARRDLARAGQFAARRAELAGAIDRKGWDGAWFRRAYFDDGTPLGTVAAEECRIDTIAQSWAILSGVAAPDKALTAMANVETHLIDWTDRIAQLFDPPFRHHVPDPGYIQGYPPGIRENGGQYTHGAIWAIFAYAKLGDTEKAGRLFSLINPINHALTKGDAELYKVEPYAIAADIYSVEPHRGRGGWTWYTGAAGWSYRAGLEAVLGIRRTGSQLKIQPCVPREWPHVEVAYKYGNRSITLNFVRQRSNSSAIVALESQNGICHLDLDGVAENASFEVLLP